MEKKNVLIIGVLAVGLILVLQLFNLQILNDQYKITAENNAYKYVTRYPVRGLIMDRNGNILVGNKNTYDIMVTPIEVKEFDTLDFCSIFNLDTLEVRQKFKEYRKYRRRIGYQALTFLKQVSSVQYSIFMEKAYKFPGFSAISRTSRNYPFAAGANLFGYVTEVDADFIKKNPGYRSGDYVGASGLEKSYEGVLKGEKGYNILLRDVHNRIQSSFEDGAHDKNAVPGKDIISTIDGHLQQYGEHLMQNKVGSVVAIEPSTGEILALISSPGIDIDQLASISKHYKEIVNDPYKPMFNRAVMSAYPPGSVFKLVNGLIGLQEGVITPQTKYNCNLGYYYGDRKLGCHAHPSPLDFTQSIMMSCNAYYCYVFRAIIENRKYGSVSEAFDNWREMVMSFGFGRKLGSDFPAELGGTLPTSKTYDKIYGKNRWRAHSIISLSIGQGEIGATPLHLANLAATIANRGYYYIPHLVKDSPDTTIHPRFKERNYTMVDTSHFHKVIQGMWQAVNSEPGAGGTARLAHVEGLDICGKTGTAQNPHGKDNAVFICFAPRENPKIAIAAYIENAGFGGTWAAPIASLMIEKYLNGEISRKDLEQRMVEANLMQYVPVRRR
ncbi:MAG: penicillin-binding protein 2 [Bacteroidales bacterium]|nr:penicillin-binding protein 2 [Bacteroidales bacterium]MBR2478010.1 penicillin-binding protein 2 [Bacteroidales bacterium]